MRAAVFAAGLAVVLAGCETFDPYSVEYSELIDESGVSVYGNLMEDISGSRWWQFTASNSNSFNVCVQISLTGSPATSGHDMGGVYRLGPGDSIDIGYVELPASFNTNTQMWDPDADGACGSPPG